MHENVGLEDLSRRAFPHAPSLPCDVPTLASTCRRNSRRGSILTAAAAAADEDICAEEVVVVVDDGLPGSTAGALPPAPCFFACWLSSSSCV
jgi:hypothetical protein